jgi:beta-galactosidase
VRHLLHRRRLNEGWRFRFDGEAASAAGPVTLPHTWNALDTMCPEVDNHYRRGRGIYECDLVPVGQPEDLRWLEFEAVAQRAWVYFDGDLLAAHHGGYTPFMVEVPNRAGLLRVVADNTPDPDLIPSDMSDFYLYGGITRNVWSYVTHGAWLEPLRVETSVSAAEAVIRLRGCVAGAADGCTVQIVLRRGDDQLAALTVDLVNGEFDHSLPPIAEPALWSPDHPALYDLQVRLLRDDRVLDQVSERIGLRWYDFPAGGPFYLNGERLMLRGTHRHEDWAGHGGAVPDAITRREFELIKAAGFNFIRLGHYPQSRAALDACDDLGLIVWEELPWCRGGVGGDTFRDHTRAMLREMITHHYNHPSIIFWGLGNELDWESEHPASSDALVRDFLAELHTLAHDLDPVRLTALRRFEFGADVVDAYSPSIWAGWYRGRYRDYADNLAAAIARYPRLLHAEWGGDSHVGRHNSGPHIAVNVESTVDNAEETGTATSGDGFARYSRDGDWSESYILDLMGWHLDVQARQPQLAGALQWAFKDFGTPLRPENPVPYVNQKGLIDRLGRPKDVYYLFQARQTSTPVVRIEGARWSIRPAHVPHRVRVISNCDEVELLVDGASHGTIRRDPAAGPLHGLIWEVELTPGSHELLACGDGAHTHLIHIEAAELGTTAADFQWWWMPALDGGQVAIQLIDGQGRPVQADERRVRFTAESGGRLLVDQGHMGGSAVVETANGRAWITAFPAGALTLTIAVDGLPPRTITLDAPD